MHRVLPTCSISKMDNWLQNLKISLTTIRSRVSNSWAIRWIWVTLLRECMPWKLMRICCMHSLIRKENWKCIPICLISLTAFRSLITFLLCLRSHRLPKELIYRFLREFTSSLWVVTTLRMLRLSKGIRDRIWFKMLGLVKTRIQMSQTWFSSMKGQAFIGRARPSAKIAVSILRRREESISAWIASTFFVNRAWGLWIRMHFRVNDTHVYWFSLSW